MTAKTPARSRNRRRTPASGPDLVHPADTLRRLAAEEIGAVVKPFGAQFPVALVYPNTYAVAMSSLGFQALAGRINRWPDAACERFFWRAGTQGPEIPLSIENQRVLPEFPVVLFSIAFEMDYINVLDVLNRAGIPLRWSDRGERDPIIVAGGKAPTMNRLPLYDFMDVVVHGDGEEAVDWLVDDAIAANGDRDDILTRLAKRPGFEIPPLVPDPSEEPPPSLSLADRLAEFPCHSTVLTPNTELAMRGLVEISRGCPYKCTFCIMGYQPYRYRWRTPDEVVEAAHLFKPHTNRIGLVASAVGIHRDIEEICERLDAMNMELSYSSLRVEDVKPAMVRSLIRSGQRTLTIAPEAGNETLRGRMRKNLTDERIEEFVAWCFELGMENLKLYYMIGIPGETDTDVLSIAAFTRRLHDIQVRAVRARARIGHLALNVGVYVPKPGTPLAEGGFCGVAEAKRRVRLLSRALGDIPNLKVHFESPREAAVQAVLSTGTRDIARFLEAALLQGKRIPVPK
jgi:radical SAM superfamily enzyme YgiQ (UPF0313 family)